MTGAPQPLVHGPYPRRALIDCLNESPRAGRSARVRSIVTGTAETIALPQPPTGRHMLARAALTEFPREPGWRAPGFTSATPWVCVFEGATVHGDGGIILAEGAVVQDTLMHCEEARQWFADRPQGLFLFSTAPPAPLSGTWLSLLGGGHWNYYHWMIDGIGRLAAADAEVLAGCDGVLLPEAPMAIAEETITRSGITRGRAVRRVAPGDDLAVERLVVPWSMSIMFQPHPRLVAWLAGLVPPDGAATPRRIWIDRRAAINRVLANEAEVIAALSACGIVPVALEGRSLMEQATLFAGADLVVAPHGAGLTNLVFARPGCHVVEVLPYNYVHWCFRHLAAAAGLDYDCVIGGSEPAARDANVHARNWTVNPLAVRAAVEAALWR